MLLFVVTACIIFVTGILSVLESALLCIDELKLATILRKSPEHSKDIRYVIHHKDAHLSSVVVLITLVSIAGSSVVGALAAQTFQDIGLIIFTLLLTYCMLVFAKMLPKLIAVRSAHQVIEITAPFIRISCRLLKPLLWITMIWARIFRLGHNSKASRDDLKSIIKHYGINGVIGQEESVLAEYALNLRYRRLDELLKTGGPMTWLPGSATVETVYEKVRTTPFKRYIVISEGEVIGVVLYRHLAAAMLNDQKQKTVSELARSAIFLEPDTSLLEAIEEFKSARASVAILPGKTPEESQFITAKQIFRAALHKSAG
ncbi:hypothetical protein CI610_00034 [invertebrate metagenome]|uniref:CNNM transmembrane domain-containing protein n=1 Tax=invertebrate metagenome TaxID=1711999 RepID=A0A2H9TCJ9_9ZZZZ